MRSLYKSERKKKYEAMLELMRNGNSNIIIYCASGFGINTSKLLMQYEGISVAGFCDKDTRKQGKFIEWGGYKLPIYSYETCIKLHKEIIWIVANASRGRGLEIVESLSQKGFVEGKDLFCIGDYLDRDFSFLEMNKDRINPVENEFSIKLSSVNKVMLMISRTCSGNEFFNSVLDWHPNILSCSVNPHVIFAVIQQCSTCCIEELPYRIVELVSAKSYTVDYDVFMDNELFVAAFQHIVNGKTELTQGEIFKAIYIADFYACGRQYKSKVSPIIYIEPHGISDLVMSDVWCDWCERYFDMVMGVTIIRNPITRLGSLFRYLEVNSHESIKERILNSELLEWGMHKDYFRNLKNKENIVAIRFEDIKLNPKNILSKLFHILGINWDDIVLQTTQNGKSTVFMGTSGYDLRPVYNKYEKYFSDFDRTRLKILYAPFCVVYNYENVGEFSNGVEYIQKLALFEKPFKFEQIFANEDFTVKQVIKSVLYSRAAEILYLNSNIGQYKEYFDFYRYLHASEF